MRRNSARPQESEPGGILQAALHFSAFSEMVLEKAQPQTGMQPGPSTPPPAPLSNAEDHWETVPLRRLLGLNRCLLFVFRPRGSSPACAPGCRTPIGSPCLLGRVWPCHTPSHTQTQDYPLSLQAFKVALSPVLYWIHSPSPTSSPHTTKLPPCNVVYTRFSAQQPHPGSV